MFNVSTGERMIGLDASVNFQLGDNHYLARPVQGVLKYPGSPEVNLDSDTPSLVTCFRVHRNQTIDGGTLSTWRNTYLDVFDANFLREVIFSGVKPQDVRFTDEANELFKKWQTLRVLYQPDSEIQTGPYYIHKGVLHSVWRVYEDRQLAFLQSMWPTLSDDRAFIQINVAGSGYRAHGIAVPPRSHTQALKVLTADNLNSDQSPLQGLRVAIKDNYHVHGTRTSLGNRAYYETHPVQETNADIVSQILDAGAHMVGKTHLSSFAMMEHPMQSVDYQAPFNPRGDGYLISGGSSGATAAAVAAYEWLDLAICTDTTGSSRIPALQAGVFGFRPTTNSISGKGLVNAWAKFDTPAWLGRDLQLFPEVLRVLRPPELRLQDSEERPHQIIYPLDFVPEDSPAQVQTMREFIRDMASATGCTCREVSIKDDWQRCAPVDERDLDQYLYNLTRHGWFYAAYHSFSGFRRRFHETNGHDPFVTEVVRWYWSLGMKVTALEHEEIMNRLSVFKKWCVDQYLVNGLAHNVLALHIDKAQPKYRDEYPGNNNPEVPGLRATYLSAILEAPELAIPISEITYQSRITGKEEKLPMVVSLMGASGQDMTLLNWTLQAMRISGRSTTVQTGRTAFTP